MTEDEMVGWHHQLHGHEFEQAPGVGDGQGSLVCCSPWSRKESDMTESLNNKKYNIYVILSAKGASLVAQILNNLPAKAGDLCSIPGLGRYIS